MRFIFPVLLILTFWEVSFATHNRAGEITYKQIGAQTVEMTVTTYTKASSTAADRDSIEIHWGDGTSEIVHRNNALTRLESNDIKINYYIATHTYPGIATYTISFLDPNRISGILNINFPNSVDIPFYLSTTLTLLDPQFQGLNNSAILLQSPIDIGCVNKVFIHNPNAYDIDGDSLAYEFTSPLQGVDMPVPDYKLPDEVGASINNHITINPKTGEIYWDSPKIQGEYNIAILVKEYRQGKLINSILRDMQILIRACENDPPSIETVDNICAVAGTEIHIPIQISDPNLGQKVKFSVTGGPLHITDPAIVIGPSNFTTPPYSAQIIWKTNCNHISPQIYQFVFRAVDNFYPDSTGLAVLKTVQIKIVGPPPEDVQLEGKSNENNISWKSPYTCENVINPAHLGFSVWRRELSNSFQQDTCSPSLDNSPYTRIKPLVTQKVNGRYIFADTDVQQNRNYCYRIQPEFAKLTAQGVPFFKFSGLSSDDVCGKIKRNVPLLTKVSIDSTSTQQGIVQIRWVKPSLSEFDTLKFIGPYTYLLYRIDNGNKTTLFSKTYPFFQTTIDTVFYDDHLNTFEMPFEYQISLVSSNSGAHDSPNATSIYLKAIGSNQKAILNWYSKTPWKTIEYKVYSILNHDSVLIGTTLDTFFTASNLVNDDDYCFFIKGEGLYPGAQIPYKITNNSQIACVRPTDDQPPCAPNLKVNSVCDLVKNGKIDDLYNTIIWNSPEVLCPNLGNDLAGFKIYCRHSQVDDRMLIATTEQNISSYRDDVMDGILGCYSITAFDKNGNESAFSNEVCIDDCPLYILPNTFTPNGDGANDLFKPRQNLFVQTVDFKVYNQWGNLLFETQNPDILWDGLDKSGNKVNTGTYYYTCVLYTQVDQGNLLQKDILSGYIHIFR
ncbi:MAG: gliding motility-associated C-terminal domain-containing protein [Lewinellaceae bacterium]|nr:gliding motility-associated C-terminal domain-containing protein [Lewinellaceae bacterium]